MRELLTQWAALEPDKHLISPISKDHAILVGNHIWKNIINLDEPTQLDLAWIQWAVQQAIVARGWYFHLAYLQYGKQYQAEAGPIRPSITYVRSDSLVEALLAAYLKALQDTSQ